MFTKIKQVVLLTILVCMVQPAFASSSFLIEDYITKDYSDLMWLLKGDLGASVRNSTVGSLENLNAGNYTDSKSSNYNFRLQSNLQYEHETENQSLFSSVLVNTSFYSSASDRYSKRENLISNRQIEIDDNVISRKYSQFTISPRTNYKKYVKNDLFYSVSASGIFDYEFSLKDNNEREIFDYVYYSDSVYYYQSKTIRDKNYDRRNYGAALNFTVGEGRQYVGIYAFTSYNIINELEKNGLLLARPDKETMIALTDIIYQFENSHTIDSRLKQIEKYDAIYSFLLQRKIVKENNHLGMLLVQDAFEMYPNETRRFGFSKSLGVGLIYRYYSIHETSDNLHERLSYRYQSDSPLEIDTIQNISSYMDSYYNERKSESMSKYALASISYAKPINMKWQLDASANGRFYFDSYVHFDNDYSYDIKKRYDLTTSLRATYFYSSRTIWRASGNYFYSRYENEILNENYFDRQRDESRWNFSLSTSLEYRLSIPTTLIAKLAYANSDMERINFDDTQSNTEYASFSFSLSLNHYIY